MNYLTETETNAYFALMRSQMENGIIVVPPNLEKRARALLDKVARGFLPNYGRGEK